MSASPFPDPNTPEINDLVVCINRCMRSVEQGIDLMVTLWTELEAQYVGMVGIPDQECKQFMFAIWAVNNFAPEIVDIVCERLFTAAVNGLPQANRSRLNTIANTLSRTAMVVWFVLGRSSSNAKISQAFTRLDGLAAEVELEFFCEQLETQCRLLLATGRIVLRSSVIRDTLKALGADVWRTAPQPPSQVASLATSAGSGFVPAIPVVPSSVVSPGSELVPASLTSERVSETPELDRGNAVATQAVDLASSRLTASILPLPGLLPPGQGLLRESPSPFLVPLPPDLSSPIAYRSSPPVDIPPKRRADASPPGHGKRQAVHVKPPSLQTRLQTSRYKRTLVPFEDLVASIIRTLAPGVWLNDDIVNTAVARFASGNIGIFNSLWLGSDAAVDRLRSMLVTKSIVLFPVNDSLASHWRLYVWESGTLCLYDSLRVAPDNTTVRVSGLIAEATGGDPSGATRVDVYQQPNGADCGLFVVAFAEIKASGLDNFAGSKAIITRDNLASELLSSRAAMLPSPVYSRPLLPLAVRVHRSLSSLRLRLANWTLPYPPAVSERAITIEHHQFGQCVLQNTAAVYHRRHKALIQEAITKERDLKDGAAIRREDVWALYNESVFTILLLRFMRVMYDVTEVNIAALSR
ncbi:hypothetical protein ACHAPU_009130 [Fusarium lateritium]